MVLSLRVQKYYLYSWHLKMKKPQRGLLLVCFTHFFFFLPGNILSFSSCVPVLDDESWEYQSPNLFVLAFFKEYSLCTMLKMLVELNCRITVIYFQTAFRMFTNNYQREHKLRVSCFNLCYTVLYTVRLIFSGSQVRLDLPATSGDTSHTDQTHQLIW